MHLSHQRWRGAAVVVAVLALAAPSVAARASSPAPAVAGAVAAAAPAPSPWEFGPEDLTLVSRADVGDGRSVDLTFTTPALSAPTKVRVVLPVGYDPGAPSRYPMLFLLHGGAGQYTDWYGAGRIADLTRELRVITVLPDGGKSAWFTDWYNNGVRGTPMWETYHVGQLISWIDQHFNTVGTRAGRAIAGLSSGGFGALHYASRHPDMFVAAAGFSAAVDTNTPPVVAGKVIDGLAAQDGGGPGSLFGLRETEEVRWRGHNPWDLASNLRDMSLTVRTGNGMAGGQFGGGGPSDPVGMFLETSCHDMSVSFHERLDALGISHVWEDYGPGTHNYDYWREDLRKTLPEFMRVFAEHQPDPSPFSYRAAEPTYDVYGWRVSIDRPAMEFSSIDDASSAGFTLSGSGVATVRTAPLYKRGKSYLVTVRGDSISQQIRLVADATGRLTIQVPLGRGNPVQQQFTPTHESPATHVFTSVVGIERVTR